MHTDFRDALQAQIAELEDQQTKLKAELARVEGHLGGLRQAMALYLGEPHSARGISRRPPSGARGSRVPDPHKSEAWAFALEKMEAAPFDGIHIDELSAEIASAGHEMSRNTLRANLSNAAREGVIDRVAYGRYRRRKPVVDEGVAVNEGTAVEEPAAKQLSALLP
jgi:hypothetical protein